jgi:hypothetical protein
VPKSCVELADKIREAPTLRAQLDALMLLAASLHAHRVSLQAAYDSWHVQIADLARGFGERIKKLTDVGQILNIWRSFAETLPFSGAPASALTAWARVGIDLEARLRAGGEPLRYLEEANARAHQRIRSLLNRFEVEDDLLAAEPAMVKISWDEHNVRSSASSSRTSGEISWTFQHAARTLWAALAAESVLQHEYLSHLAPRNLALSIHVRDGWLVEVLFGDIRDGSPEGRADVYCFKHLRQKLGANPKLDDLAAYGSPGLRDAALFMLGRNPALFRRFTREVLAMEPSQEGARQVDEVFREMERKGDTELGRIFESAGEVGIKGLLEALRRFP